MKNSGKLAFHVVNSNIANDYLPILPTSLGIIALFEKINDREPILTIISNIGEVTMPLFQLSVLCEKCDAARHWAVIGKQLLISNYRNRVR